MELSCKTKRMYVRLGCATRPYDPILVLFLSHADAFFTCRTLAILNSMHANSQSEHAVVLLG
jgi:hypothetical protein